MSEEMGRRCLALPFFGGMTEVQVDTVCGELAELLGETRTARRASA